ncbi:hypothetical protein [Haloarcula marina]|uniref:hypothetical protein n=1 Tax=Haloarcula marina TaxID=2961574 RepID=UPI0020B8BDB0|nr:hypothetical protein [Halomicroarcula marina]
MSPNFSQRIKSLFSATDPAHGPGPDAQDRTTTTALWCCAECSKTFIVEEMDICPDCGSAVEQTPTERDLGLL